MSSTFYYSRSLFGPKNNEILNERRLHPGIEWRHFGTSACEFVESCLQNEQKFEGAVTVSLEMGYGCSRTLHGWWSVLKAGREEKRPSRVLLWGDLS